VGKLMSLGGVTGGLLCAYNGGSIPIRDSAMAAQDLRMDHGLMSGHKMNDDFSFGVRPEIER
jgi:hypothetical protein